LLDALAQNFSSLRLAQANHIASAADHAGKYRALIGKCKASFCPSAIDPEIERHGVTLPDS
jgi:hypothetical protein